MAKPRKLITAKVTLSCGADVTQGRALAELRDRVNHAGWNYQEPIMRARKVEPAPRHLGGYVVIYDHGDPDAPTEEYYGYFCTPGEAKDAYADLSHGQKYRNARLCLMVERIKGDHDD